MALQLQGKNLTALIPPPADRGAEYRVELSMDADFGEPGCVTRSAIEQVRIEAGGNDGWLLADAATIITGRSGATATMTDNPAVNAWVDGNQADVYSYDATVLVLSLPDCIDSLKLTATTGDLQYAESSSPHKLVLQLDDRTFEIPLPGTKPKDSVYTYEVAMHDVSGIVCLRKGDIKQARIEEGGNDGWYTVDMKVEDDSGDELTANFPFKLWVDGNQEDEYTYDAKRLVLKLA